VDEWLRVTLERIRSGALLPPRYFASLDCNAALDARDADPSFEGEWLRISNEVSRRWPTANQSAESSSLVEDIRRESFFSVSRSTGQHEIASYVSDDFDLLARARLLGIVAPMLAEMWTVYERGEFPTPASLEP
jgi:hypothetical protein